MAASSAPVALADEHTPSGSAPKASGRRRGPVAWAGVVRTRPRGLDPVAIFVLAVAVRLMIVARSAGGPLGDFGYDSSVYYNAADAVIHGRLPYADFTLLHPPALMLVLTPFAFLGTLTSDHTGFVVANSAFEVIGAINSVLVVFVARRAGLGRLAALAGGFCYAVWPGAAGAEISVRLEPLGNLFLLCALLVLVRTPLHGARKRQLLLCGALLGAATMTKIWWVVPLLVVVLWAARRDRRHGLLMLAGAAASMVAVAGPFFVVAPLVMWRMVVTDQLGRPAIGASIPTRLGEMTSLDAVLPMSGAGALVLVPIGALVLGSFVHVWRRWPDMRPVVALAAAQLIVLLAAPTYFGFYADYLTPAVSLVFAGVVAPHVGLGHVSSTRLRLCIAGAAVAAVAASGVVEIVADAPAAISPFPGALLARAASRARLRCVMADSPMALIELDVLSRDLANGCPDRVDVSGSTYDVDKPVGRPVPRVHNLRWQRDLYRYLTSGNAEIVIRHATGISSSTTRRLGSLPVIASTDGRTLRRTP